MADLAKGAADAFKARADGVHARHARGSGGLGDAAEEGDGKHHPPHRHAEERHAHRHVAIGQAKPLRAHVPDQVDQQEDAAAQVAQGIAARRDLVDLVGMGHVGQQGIVKDVGGRVADAGHDEKDDGHHPVAALDEIEQPGKQDGQEHKGAQEAFLAAGIVGDGAQDRAQKGHEEHLEGGRIAPDARGQGLVGQVGGGHAAKIGRQQRGHHRGGKSRVGPVVHAPGADGAAIHVGSGFGDRHGRLLNTDCAARDVHGQPAEPGLRRKARLRSARSRNHFVLPVRASLATVAPASLATCATLISAVSCSGTRAYAPLWAPRTAAPAWYPRRSAPHP